MALDSPPEGAVCRPNITGPGRKKRRRAGMTLAALSGAGLLALVAGGAAWPWRLLMGLPVALAVVTWLQATRGT